ncbi:MAG: gliding motility-associated ABC transporter ATP-binding subunit GldA [Bacteroidales bacterium]|nr:gliding motility-associated ABC transporter ATP-binding subunit GldA [Bacteroidales bacterium]
MSIIVENITKIYGVQKALNHVSFEVQPGEIAGFIGPNGAGKSTMMKIICGYSSPNEGSVKVNNEYVDQDSVQIRKKLGYLPENNPLYLDMYVKEYLNYVGGIYKMGKNKKKAIDRVIEETGLQLEVHKKIGALSKGYKQRVGLAQALIHNPDVLILDEPTSGLDPNQIVEIRELISSVGKEKTVMLSTHIMQEVEAICDKIIIIDKGKIVADGKHEDIKIQSAGNKQTIIVEFDNAVNQDELNRITGVEKVVVHDKNIYLLECSLEKDIRATVFNFAVKKNISVLSLQKKEKSLEQVFQELTRFRD